MDEPDDVISDYCPHCACVMPQVVVDVYGEVLILRCTQCGDQNQTTAIS